MHDRMSPESGDGLSEGLKQAIVQVDRMLTAIVESATKGKAPAAVLSAFQDALEAFRRATNLLTDATDSNEPSPKDLPGREPLNGTTTTQQAANPFAVPVTHQAMRA